MGDENPDDSQNIRATIGHRERLRRFPRFSATAPSSQAALRQWERQPRAGLGPASRAAQVMDISHSTARNRCAPLPGGPSGSVLAKALRYTLHGVIYRNVPLKKIHVVSVRRILFTMWLRVVGKQSVAFSVTQRPRFFHVPALVTSESSVWEGHSRHPQASSPSLTKTGSGPLTMFIQHTVCITLPSTSIVGNRQVHAKCASESCSRSSTNTCRQAGVTRPTASSPEAGWGAVE